MTEKCDDDRKQKNVPRRATVTARKYHRMIVAQ